MTRPAPAPPTASDDNDHAADRAAIAQIIADVEAGLNRKDPDLMTRHFAPNAIAVGADGSAVTGRDALREAHVRGLSGFLRDQYARYEIADLTFLRPDVAILHKRARATDRDGRPLGVGHAMIALYVLTKERDRWWIVARQNTLMPT
jgi:uncharacterized protein (TIGR02246 family)